MRGAMELALKVQFRVEMAEAAQWLDRNLSSVIPGAATVVFHSKQRDAITALQNDQQEVAELLRTAIADVQ